MKLTSIILSLSILIVLSNISFGQNNIVSKDSKISYDWLLASKKFMDGDYNGCIPLYESVLKNDSLLNKDYWYVLIDNLGMAYGITGDLKSSEETLRYGLKKDPEYPMFYFNLACVYAEKNDMDECINYLKSAYKYKKNTLQGETLPDPATDDSFQKFMKDKKFVSAINEMKKQ